MTEFKECTEDEFESYVSDIKLLLENNNFLSISSYDYPNVSYSIIKADWRVYHEEDIPFQLSPYALKILDTFYIMDCSANELYKKSLGYLKLYEETVFNSRQRILKDIEKSISSIDDELKSVGSG